MKKKILHIISSLNWRGGEQQVDYLINHESTEFEYYLFCPENAELVKRNLAKNKNIFTYKKRFGVDIFAALELKKVCKEDHIDLIHLHDSHALNTYLLADLLGMNIPAVIHRHVNFRVVSKWKYTNQKIKKIICVSEEIKKEFSKFIENQKLVIINPGIDIQKFSKRENPQELRSEINIAAGKKIIGIVSALEKEKNIDEFLNIAYQFNAVNKDHQFVIIGDGSLYNSFKTQYSLSNVHFMGFRNNIEELLPAFDVFLFTSVNEGFPLVVLEAMASKIPVVCHHFPSAGELIQDNQNGLLYLNTEEAVRKIKLLITDPAARTAIVENAYQFVRQFDISLMNNKTELIYHTVFANP